MAGLYIETKLRPCYVVGNDSEAKALFHCWSYHSDIYAPSVMIGGHGGGVVARTGAVVELEDGSVTVVRPESIRFVPWIFDEYGWDGRNSYVSVYFYRRG